MRRHHELAVDSCRRRCRVACAANPAADGEGGRMTGPTDLVAERIRRANPSIGREAARELAAELDDIIACALKRWKAAPDFGVAHVDVADAAFDDVDGNDLIQTMTYAIIDKALSASEVEHLADIALGS
jgi:hypothetical protein